MSQNRKVLVQINNAGFKYPGEEPLFRDLKLTIMEGDVAALVGANGSGKSTLLKLLTGQINLIEGKVEINCKPYYVPQVDLSIQEEEKTIFEYIADHYENWWEVTVETERIFGMDLDVDAKAKSLSGGELMKLNLAIALVHNPDLLIMDEPTNHLDVKSIGNLIDFIKENKNKYSFLIVSHDIFFLDSVIETVYALENKEITTYGGNYTFYKEQKELHERGVKKRYALAQHKLQQAEAQAQKELEKQEQRAAKTRKDIVEGKEQDKYILGMKKDSGGNTAKAKSVTFDRLQTQAEEAMETYTPNEDRRLAFVTFQNTKSNPGKIVFDIADATLEIKDKTLLKNFNLKVGYGDRLVLAGDNGTGKTSLIKALLKQVDPDTKDTNLGLAELKGQVEVPKGMKWAYIDQNYSLIRPELNLVENLMNYNESYTEAIAKEQLGKFQFKSTNEMNQKGKSLSGGEMVRLILAMITALPLDIIVLDEPTNNLDVETVEVLSNALNNFRGTIMVISHNIDFLNSIKVTNAYLIADQKLKIMKVDPTNKEGYYKALLEA